MSVHTVAILSPGDMGHAVGRVLKESGLDVVTCLAGRSQRTHALAARAGIRDLADLESVAEEADLILSILVPSQAVVIAERVAQALEITGRETSFADCNAISPATSRKIDEIIASVGGKFIDASIIGPPPGNGRTPRFYASGPHKAVLGELDGRGIKVKLMRGDVGQASGIKMCYAALTKGTSALQAAVLVSAERLGLTEELREEFEASQPEALKAMQHITRVPAKAFRWIGEMEEIAATFESVGVTPRLHLGAADIFAMIADSPLGSERPEIIDEQRSLEQTVAILAQSLKARRE